MHIKKMEETIHGLEFKIKERDLKTKSLVDKVLYRKPTFEIWNLKVLSLPFSVNQGPKMSFFFFSFPLMICNNWLHIEG